MKTKKALITVVAVIACLLLTVTPPVLPSELASATADSSGNMNTTITIQNAGEFCTSVWIYYKEEGNCEQMKAQHIEQLAPGEAIRIGPGPDADMPFPSPEIDAPWMGSADITASEPLAIVVNQWDASSTMLLTHAGVPYPDYGDTTNYAPLVYRGFDGWDAEIQVQNLTQESRPTFVCVDFMDQSGDEIFFVCDWVCRNGTNTFYLPDFTDLGVNLPSGYVGAAEIRSLEQVDYPGDVSPSQPIASVVSLINSDSGEALSYNAFPSQQVTGVTTFALPLVRKPQQGPTSKIVIRNNSDCNQIRGKIWISDETGHNVGAIHVPWLHPKHLKIIDLAYQGWLPPGFVGAGTFEVLEVVQLCDVDDDGHVDSEPIVPSVVVLDRDDSVSGQEAFPITAAPPTPDPNTRIQVPVIDVDDGWGTWIQTQNVGDAPTGAITIFWGDYSGLCPITAPGPIGRTCMHIPENGVWTQTIQIPPEAKSAILYSVSDDLDLYEAACEAADSIDSHDAWRNWEATYAYSGEPLAVTVDRSVYDGSSASGMYNGFSETMLGSGTPFKYSAFPVMNGYNEPPPPSPPVHYLGYSIKEVEPEFVPREVTFRDQFVDGRFLVQKPDMLFTPADKEKLPEQANFANVAGVETHLKRYELKNVKDGPKDVKVEGIRVTNQFGEFVVEAQGPDHLLIPTAKAFLPEPGLPTGNVDHFLCYEIKEVEVREDVSIADQFGTADYEVELGISLCNPVEKQVNGEITPIQNPDLHLMCFEVKEKDVEVYTNNQFGPERLVVDKPESRKELCVPSSKTPPP